MHAVVGADGDHRAGRSGAEGRDRRAAPASIARLLTASALAAAPPSPVPGRRDHHGRLDRGARGGPRRRPAGRHRRRPRPRARRRRLVARRQPSRRGEHLAVADRRRPPSSSTDHGRVVAHGLGDRPHHELLERAAPRSRVNEPIAVRRRLRRWAPPPRARPEVGGQRAHVGARRAVDLGPVAPPARPSSSTSRSGGPSPVAGSRSTSMPSRASSCRRRPSTLTADTIGGTCRMSPVRAAAAARHLVERRPRSCRGWRSPRRSASRVVVSVPEHDLADVGLGQHGQEAQQPGGSADAEQQHPGGIGVERAGVADLPVVQNARGPWPPRRGTSSPAALSTTASRRARWRRQARASSAVPAAREPGVRPSPSARIVRSSRSSSSGSVAPGRRRRRADVGQDGLDLASPRGPPGRAEAAARAPA